MALVKSLSVLPTLEDDLSRLEQILVDSVVAENDYLTEIASHLITAGGKRVRPGFAIAASGVETTRHTCFTAFFGSLLTSATSSHAIDSNPSVNMNADLRPLASN